MDIERLRAERNIWLATVRADGRPHLVPIWFVWHDERCYVCTQESVKSRNLRANPKCSFALEDGNKPVLAEGEAEFLNAPFPEPVLAEFKRKYDWTINTDPGYTVMFAIKVSKWLKW
jgi:F420H(2)-dependent biliverdin reductase